MNSSPTLRAKLEMHDDNTIYLQHSLSSQVWVVNYHAEVTMVTVSERCSWWLWTKWKLLRRLSTDLKRHTATGINTLLVLQKTTAKKTRNCYVSLWASNLSWTFLQDWPCDSLWGSLGLLHNCCSSFGNENIRCQQAFLRQKEFYHCWLRENFMQHNKKRIFVNHEISRFPNTIKHFHPTHKYIHWIHINSQFRPN